MENAELIPTLANVTISGQDIFVMNQFAIRLVSMVNVWKKMVPTSADVTWGGKMKLAMPACHTGTVLTRVKVPVKSQMNADVPLAPPMTFARASSHLQINQFQPLIY